MSADRLNEIEARVTASRADAWIDTASDLTATIAALRAVLAQHPSTELPVAGESFDTCMVCLTAYPCPTVAAITDALS